MSESIETATKSLKFWAHRALQAASQKESGQLTTPLGSEVGRALQRWGCAELRGGELVITNSGVSAISLLDVEVPDYYWFDFTAHVFYDSDVKRVCISVVMDTRSEIGVDVPPEERIRAAITLDDVYHLDDFPPVRAQNRLAEHGFYPSPSAIQNRALLVGWRVEPFGWSMTVHPGMEPPTRPDPRR